MKKVYYKIQFKLLSAMNIGCGVNDNSDSDVLKDSTGNPFVPGTTLAGIYRSFFDIDYKQQYFGNVPINTGNNSDGQTVIESKVKVYDAYPINEEVNRVIIKKRDCVGLDEYKTAIKGAKFDFEVVEPGVEFITYIEQDKANENDLDIGTFILEKWKSEGLMIGAKTGRGLGKTKLCYDKTYRAEFDLDDDNSLNKWLDFDMNPDERIEDDKQKEDDKWIEYDKWKKKNDQLINSNKAVEDTASSGKDKRITICLRLKQKEGSGISIRRYTTEINTKKDPQADFVQMTSKLDGKEMPVIPGTSWAGAFKHHMEKLLGNKKESINILFGSTTQKSGISFSESIIKDAKPRVITRNAIDRFTGGTVDGALYTEKYYYGGTTDLDISFPLCYTPKSTDDSEVKDKIEDLICKNSEDCDMKKLIDALVTSIFDLHFGFMAIGGLTAVGRGMFELISAKINGEDIKLPDDKNATEIFSEWLTKVNLKDISEEDKDDNK